MKTIPSREEEKKKKTKPLIQVHVMPYMYHTIKTKQNSKTFSKEKIMMPENGNACMVSYLITTLQYFKGVRS
jgi:CMP-N-acetylneuraminic acid synthetase